MLTADGCRERRRRLLDLLRPAGPVVLADPIHLRYFANFYVDPFSLGADFGGVLRIEPDGRAVLYHDNRLPRSVEAAHVDERVPIHWYDGQSPGRGPRRVVLRRAVTGTVIQSVEIPDSLGALHSVGLHEIVGEMRRRKDPDELDVIRACMKVTDAGHAWARANVRPGMTELDVYAGVVRACNEAAGGCVLVYGDFIVSPGPERRVGPPTPRVIQSGEMFILDFSVVIQGYRSDFTNTLVVGREPTPDQRRLFDHCTAAMAAGERELRAGNPCQIVYDAVNAVFRDAGMADHFPHHAGHGLGLSHPEPPFIVRHSTETLAAGDVVTLEPGLYVTGVGGIRIEHNYLVTDAGFERLSNHVISLT